MKDIYIFSNSYETPVGDTIEFKNAQKNIRNFIKDKIDNSIFIFLNMAVYLKDNIDLFSSCNFYIYSNCINFVYNDIINSIINNKKIKKCSYIFGNFKIKKTTFFNIPFKFNFNINQLYTIRKNFNNVFNIDFNNILTKKESTGIAAYYYFSSLFKTKNIKLVNFYQTNTKDLDYLKVFNEIHCMKDEEEILKKLNAKKIFI